MIYVSENKYILKPLMCQMSQTQIQHVVAVGVFNRVRVQSLGLMKVNKRKA